MQKKLLAVAVAGAFAAPAVAVAQSTVQVYGSLYIEYAFVDQGTGKQDVDFFQAPGSRVGFKGEEKLGGGLSAWFQCETSADPRGGTGNGDGLCSRNSAVGLKGSFGNLFVGTWDTPFKRMASPNAVGSNDTGVFGSAFLLHGASTTTSESGSATGATLNRQTFKRRQRNSINYDTPNFGGFQGHFAFSTLNGATAISPAATASKPRIWSIGAHYKNGPIYVSGGYEQHKDFGSTTSAATAVPGDDKAWHIGGNYTFGGKIQVGGLFTQREFETGAATGEIDAWTLGVEWKLGGPHAVHASYTEADNASGTPGASVFGAVGSGAGTAAAVGTVGGTGGKLWQIRYVHSLSKRTQLTAGYVKLENDAGGLYALGGLGTPAAAGQDQDAFALAVRHSF